jgi:hypothetical protein
MSIDGNRLQALPRLLDVSISFRLIVIALLLLFRGCAVPRSPFQPIQSWAESQIHRVFTQAHVELPAQGRRAGSRRNLRSIIRRRVRRVVRHGKAFVGFTLVCIDRTTAYWDHLSRFHSRDTFCTSGTSP